MAEKEKLINIGSVVSNQLEQVGITSWEQLNQRGSRQAWLDLKSLDPSACYSRLCALEGAIQKIRWHDLPPGDKAELKAFYNDFK